MTEHERRVNDDAIAAYKQGETAIPANSVVTGIGQNYAKIQQKHLKRELNHRTFDQNLKL
jgi:hypothetical protein